jgi:5-methylcytosine-specific restriction endonuclease McrA
MAAIYALNPERFFLGTLCKRNHQWEWTGCSLRYCSDKTCVQCAKEKSLRQSKTGKQAEANAKRRQRYGRPSRAKDANGRILPVGITAVWAAICRAGKLPSVAQLVVQAQREYWAEHPEIKSAYLRERDRRHRQWRQMTDAEYRLYHRQKSKRRKALERGSIGLHVTGKQVDARFAQFNHCCAYCGTTGDLHIEHVVPISKGGTHVLSNIVPACKGCNLSKRDKDAEGWYRNQPFYCEKRWRRILKVMGTGKGSPQQLALL